MMSWLNHCWRGLCNMIHQSNHTIRRSVMCETSKLMILPIAIERGDLNLIRILLLVFPYSKQTQESTKRMPALIFFTTSSAYVRLKGRLRTVCSGYCMLILRLLRILPGFIDSKIPAPSIPKFLNHIFTKYRVVNLLLKYWEYIVYPISMNLVSTLTESWH